MPREVEYHPSATEEARAAYRWYKKQNRSAAAAFLSELDLAALEIGEAPGRWPQYIFSTRRRLFRRFPFFIVYRERDDRVQIIAVVHARRKPGYWKTRFPIS